ncbi:MAG: RagB/SusD family nutrient uptake outer membrane protein [Tannerellaceae bacterium]|jgi:hypothetical protein|nr:RagB/SusD family nutrient uptake outer membrane protein [Tannerellaceae bacterium]
MNTNKLFSVLLASFLLCGCNDFLEIEPQAKLGSDVYMNIEENAEKVITSLYNMLQVTQGDGPDGNYMNHHYEWFMGSVATDDAEKGSTVGDLMDLTLVANYAMTPANTIVRGFYVHSWTAISRANYAAGHLEDAQISESVKQRMWGEVHFFKAYYYFYLLRHFGGMPILTHSVELEEFGNMPRASFTETMDYIVEEFTEAIRLLPDAYPSSEVGRATKNAARAFLARVLVYRLGTDAHCPNSWQDVSNLTSAIIASGLYDLHPNYAVLFEAETQNSIESIFEVQSKEGPYGSGSFFWDWMVQGNRQPTPDVFTMGWGFHNPTEDLVRAFDPTDPRLSSTVYGPTFNNGTLFGRTPLYARNEQMTNYLCRKVALPEYPMNGTTKPVILMRYADVLLMHAEASYNLGKEEDARNLVNRIRERARNSSYCKGYNVGDYTGYVWPTTTPDIPECTASGQNLLQAIWDERRIELATEGYRGWDLIRTGRLVDRVERVKDFQRDPGNPLFLETGTGDSQQERESSRELRVAGIRANILRSSLNSLNAGDYINIIPVMPLPDTEVTYWNLTPNPY